MKTRASNPGRVTPVAVQTASLQGTPPDDWGYGVSSTHRPMCLCIPMIHGVPRVCCMCSVVFVTQPACGRWDVRYKECHCDWIVSPDSPCRPYQQAVKESWGPGPQKHSTTVKHLSSHSFFFSFFSSFLPLLVLLLLLYFFSSFIIISRSSPLFLYFFSSFIIISPPPPSPSPLLLLLLSSTSSKVLRIRSEYEDQGFKPRPSHPSGCSNCQSKGTPPDDWGYGVSSTHRPMCLCIPMIHGVPRVCCMCSVVFVTQPACGRWDGRYRECHCDWIVSPDSPCRPYQQWRQKAGGQVHKSTAQR